MKEPLNILVYLSSLIVALIGVVFLVIAFMKASDYYKEPLIKKYVKLSVVCIAMFFTAVVIYGYIIKDESLQKDYIYMAFSVILWTLLIGSTIFWLKASSLLAEKTGVSMIKTGAIVELVGSILLIFLIGGFVFITGLIIQFLGWNKIKEKPPQEGAL